MRAPRDLADMLNGASLLAATANVIMQLGLAPVGYGVVESRVPSGQLFRHPVKRNRTTLTYLAVAVLGTPQEKQRYRRGVNAVHTQVRSTAQSPVAYHAFDRRLQLWVAACLYKGFEDTHRAFDGAPPPEAVYQEGATLGTTLQVPAAHWPATRAAFDEYWARGLTEVAIDDTVRDYLTALIRLEFLPRPLARVLAPLNTFVTAGFLPPVFRAQLGLRWSARRQRRFDRAMSAVGTVTRALPGPARRFPLNAFLWDMRLRSRLGKPLV